MAPILILPILAILAALPAVRSYALPGPCSGICTNAHDPSIIARNGTYYRFSTGGRIAMHTAPDITGPWTYKGPLLPKGSIINLRGNQDLWAPEVSEVNGSYFTFYSVSTFGSQTSAIGAAQSKDLQSWTDLGSTGVTSDSSKPYNAIDANLIDVNGSKLLTFGSFWNGIYQAQMQISASSIKASQPYLLARDPRDPAMEGPTVFWYGGFYYLFFSKGSCCGYDKNMPASGKEYKIMVCRSTSPTGNFVDRAGVSCTNGGGTVVLESHSSWVFGPGGQCLYDDPKLGPIIGYHYVDRRIGYADGQKRFGWNKMDFGSGWPVIVV